MGNNKNTDQTKKQDKEEIPQDANKDKTTQDFTGYPHYPANEEMLKHGEKENLSADEESFNAPDSSQQAPAPPKKEELRGEMDHDSNDLPGKKDNVNREA